MLPITANVEAEIAVTHVNLQPGLVAAVDPGIVTVTLRGPAPALRTLQTSSVIISLNLSGLGPGTYALIPDVSEPPQIQVDSIDPPRVRVVITTPPTPVPTPRPAATPVPTPELPPATPTPSSEALAPLRR